jgi:hypothetical protein
MRRSNTDSTPNKPVTLPLNQLLILYAVTSPVHILRYGVTIRGNVTSVYPPLWCHAWEFTAHPSCIPDVRLSDFHFLGSCKKHLAGRQAGCCLMATDTWHWFLLLNASNNSVEVWCVPSATHVSCIRHRIKLFWIRAFVTLRIAPS